MVAAPLAWNALVKGLPIKEMFQHLVTQAIDLGLGTQETFAVDRGMQVMRELGFSAPQLMEAMALLGQNTIHFRQRPHQRRWLSTSRCATMRLHK